MRALTRTLLITLGCLVALPAPAETLTEHQLPPDLSFRRAEEDIGLHARVAVLGAGTVYGFGGWARHFLNDHFFIGGGGWGGFSGLTEGMGMGGMGFGAVWRPAPPVALEVSTLAGNGGGFVGGRFGTFLAIDPSLSIGVDWGNLSMKAYAGYLLATNGQFRGPLGGLSVCWRRVGYKATLWYADDLARPARPSAP